MLTRINKLKNFREKIYSIFNSRKDSVMNLLDAISSYGFKAKSVVELSEAKCFERKYSSITDAISTGLKSIKWPDITKEVFNKIYNTDENSSVKKPPCFLTDCTPNPRPFAKKLADKTITHAPNPAPGNKPICSGHQYSLLAVLPQDEYSRDKNWITPLSMTRVSSDKKGNEVGMEVLIDTIDKLGLKEELTINVADSLYGSETCKIIMDKNENLINIFRLNSSRNIYLPVSPSENSRKKYGDKMKLNNPNTHTKSDDEAEIPWVTRRGKNLIVKLKMWKNATVRGSKKYKGYEHPMNIIQSEVFDENNNKIFKNPMWLAVYGKRRNEIRIIDAFEYYRSRYDIEHFFRFGKTKLLMSSYQTPDVEHEENWWQMCILAYNQLYLAQHLSKVRPKEWEKYLPEYKNNNKSYTSNTPSQTQRSFENILTEIGTPAKISVPRGMTSGRLQGFKAHKRENSPIIFKSKKSTNTKVSDSEKTSKKPKPQNLKPKFHPLSYQLYKIFFQPKKINYG